MLSTEKRTLELRLKEVKDNVEWWKRRADNIEKVKEKRKPVGWKMRGQN